VKNYEMEELNSYIYIYIYIYKIIPDFNIASNRYICRYSSVGIGTGQHRFNLRQGRDKFFFSILGNWVHTFRVDGRGVKLTIKLHIVSKSNYPSTHYTSSLPVAYLIKRKDITIFLFINNLKCTDHVKREYQNSVALFALRMNKLFP
jgi:hypothetical protein